MLVNERAGLSPTLSGCSGPGLEAMSPRPTLGLSNSELARELRVRGRSALGRPGFKYKILESGVRGVVVIRKFGGSFLHFILQSSFFFVAAEENENFFFKSVRLQ